MNTKEAMKIPKFNDKYLDTFFREKDLRSKTYRVNGHSIPTGVVLEHIAQTRGREREQIKDIIRKIDFKNGNLHHFFEHLAKGIAERYDQQGRQASTGTKQALIKLGSENPDLRDDIRPILNGLKKEAAMNLADAYDKAMEQFKDAKGQILDTAASYIEGNTSLDLVANSRKDRSTITIKVYSRMYGEKAEDQYLVYVPNTINDGTLQIRVGPARGRKEKITVPLKKINPKFIGSWALQVIEDYY